MAKDTNSLGIIISVAVAVLLGVILVGILSSEVNDVTGKLQVADEAHAMTLTGYTLINETAVYTVTNAPTGWKKADCPLTSFSIENQSGTALTLTTDYTVDLSAGTYQLVNNDNTNTTHGLYGAYNNTYVSYTYCPDEYVVGWGNTISNLVPGFFALGILIGAAFVIIYILKQEGIAD